MQRAAAVRAAFAAEQVAAGRRAWRTPRALTFSTWARNTLATQTEEPGADWPRLLTEREEWALTREFAQEAASDYQFAARRAVASQLRSATELLDEWQLRQRIPQLRVWPESELLRRGLEWLGTRYQALQAYPLRRQLDRLGPLSDARVRYVAGSYTPIAHHTLTRVSGTVVATGGVTSTAYRLDTDTIDSECAAVAEWARRRLLERPEQRLLVVAPDLPSRRGRLERALSQALEPSRWVADDDGSRSLAFEGGRSLSSFALVQAALASLQFLTRPLPFEAASAWLRTPFAGAPDASVRARFERFLREAGRLKVDWRHVETLARSPRAPTGCESLATRLQAAHQQLPPRRARPIEWAPAFESALRELGWPGEAPLDSESQQVRQRWQELLGEFASLGHVWEALTASDAVDALTEIADQVKFDVASRDVPLLVTDALHTPVVAYDAIWVMGLDADTWPPAPQPHPLIPLPWQIEAGMPNSSGDRLHAQAIAMLATWREHAREVVLSAPHTRDDSECTPSPLLSTLPPWPNNTRVRGLTATLRGDPVFEELPDYRGIAFETGARARHGSRVFELQTDCPFRAYAELRLGADALQTPVAGIDERDRGIWLHAALARFWQMTPSNAALAELSDAAVETRATECVTAARRETQPRWRAAATPSTLEREALRLQQLIVAGAAVERDRTAFAVLYTERARRVVLGGVSFEFKLDRVDRLEPNGLVIIDYKSGTDKSVEWQHPRPSPPQLLAYLAADWDEPVEALALQYLSRRKARYRGAAATKRLLPGVGAAFCKANKNVPDAEARTLWRNATHAWRTQIGELAAQYVAGDARVDPRKHATCATCHLTALCRRSELWLDFAPDDEADDADDEESPADE